MNLRESISFKHTAAPKKQRKVLGYWNWPDLIALAEKALETGHEQSGPIEYGYYAVATPDYGVIEKAITPEYLATHEKVRIFLYASFFTLHAEKGPTQKPEWLKEKRSSTGD
jgi:hypothetical protein